VTNRRRFIASGAMPALLASIRVSSQPAGRLSDEKESLRRAAVLVRKILDGANPGEPPFEQSTTYDLAINLKTAKALGLAIPGPMLASARVLIEQ
jgi:ABC-type uncharacterized transport system substrate-binding protein